MPCVVRLIVLPVAYLVSDTGQDMGCKDKNILTKRMVSPSILIAISRYACSYGTLPLDVSAVMFECNTPCTLTTNMSLCHRLHRTRRMRTFHPGSRSEKGSGAQVRSHHTKGLRMEARR